jgi:hypothetical protein
MTWTDENYFYNPFEHIWFKSVFDLENYGFWKCGFNNSCSYTSDKRAWMHNKNDIKSSFSQNVFRFKM